jgi:hypothetical protein
MLMWRAFCMWVTLGAQGLVLLSFQWYHNSCSVACVLCGSCAWPAVVSEHSIPLCLSHL